MEATPISEGERDDSWLVSTCDMCYNACTIRVHRVDGVATKIEGIPEVGPNYGKLCAKGSAALLNAYNPNRIAHPLRRTNPEKGVDADWIIGKLHGSNSHFRGRARRQLVGQCL